MENAQLIDFKLELKSKGLNRLIKDIFDKMPGLPPQETSRIMLRKSLRIVLINLISAKNRWIRYSRNKNEYYGTGVSYRNIFRVIDHLEQQDLIRHYLGFYYPERNEGRQSRMAASIRLMNFFDRYMVRHKEITAERYDELIILKNKHGIVPYADTIYTESARNNLKLINSVVESSSVTHPGVCFPRKGARRIYNNSFEYGGRAYGVGWQGLNSNQRSMIKINGYETAELDFDCFHPSILYSMIGIELNKDVYQVEGFSQEHRSFFKAIQLIRINCTNNIAAAYAVEKELLERRKRAFKEGRKIIRIPSHFTIMEMIERFMDQHRAIAHLFDGKTGLRLQRLDSDLAESVSIKFASRGIPILCVHDSFIMERKYKDELEQVMRDEFHAHFGVNCGVSDK